jgi:hypothetical protein
LDEFRCNSLIEETQRLINSSSSPGCKFDVFCLFKFRQLFQKHFLHEV